jgi:hypothetical protein
MCTRCITTIIAPVWLRLALHVEQQQRWLKEDEEMGR